MCSNTAIATTSPLHNLTGILREIQALASVVGALATRKPTQRNTNKCGDEYYR